jgi:hypothetical protein
MCSRVAYDRYSIAQRSLSLQEEASYLVGSRAALCLERKVTGIQKNDSRSDNIAPECLGPCGVKNGSSFPQIASSFGCCWLDYRRDVGAIDLRMSEIDSEYQGSSGVHLGRRMSLTIWSERSTRCMRDCKSSTADLQEREAKVRRLVDANIIGICIFDLNRRLTDPLPKLW